MEGQLPTKKLLCDTPDSNPLLSNSKLWRLQQGFSTTADRPSNKNEHEEIKVRPFT